MQTTLLSSLIVLLLTSNVESGKCFHNSVPFLTKEAACATMGPVLSNTCLMSQKPPLFYIPQFLTNTVFAANRAGDTAALDASKRNSITLFSNYSTLVMQQEYRFLQASIVAVQTCKDAAAQSPPAATPLDLIGANKKLIQAQNNYDAAQESLASVTTNSQTLGFSKRSATSKQCANISLFSSCTTVGNDALCQCFKWYNCLSKTHRNCFNGLGANAISSNFQIANGGSSDNTDQSCSQNALLVATC